ncbi:MAG: hypothetical protein VX663_02460 [Pseudomonadota bacterium]|nr:hypothetical protein [Pseudomonadota bacterium]
MKTTDLDLAHHSAAHTTAALAALAAPILGITVAAIWLAPLMLTGSLAGYGFQGFVVQTVLSALLLSALFGSEVIAETTGPQCTAERRDDTGQPAASQKPSRLLRRLRIMQRGAAPATNPAATTAVDTSAPHCQAG